MFHCLHRKAGILLFLAMTGILSFAVPPAFADPGDSAVITLRRDAFPPDAVTDLTASTTYQVRYTTCSVADLPGNTTDF